MLGHWHGSVSHPLLEPRMKAEALWTNGKGLELIPGNSQEMKN